MVLHHFDHQAGQSAAAGGDLMHDGFAAGLILQGSLDRLDLATDASRASEELLFFPNRMTHADNIGGYPIRNKSNRLHGKFASLEWTASAQGCLLDGGDHVIECLRYQYDAYVELYREYLPGITKETNELSPGGCGAVACFMLAGVDGLILQELARPNQTRSKQGIEALIRSTQIYARSIDATR
jgi:hypothetical protein